MELKSGVLIGVEGLYKGFEFDITKHYCLDVMQKNVIFYIQKLLME